MTQIRIVGRTLRLLGVALGSFVMGAALVSGLAVLSRGLWLPAAGAWLDASEAELPARPMTAFVLAGGATDRAGRAAQLYQQGWLSRVVVTGSSVAEPIRALGERVNEAELTARVLRRMGVPDSVIVVADTGTSTHEECVWLVNYCRAHGLTEAVVISHRYHTRRIRWQLDRLFRASDPIGVTLVGASASDYAEARWWHSEAGLLFVVNEYLKLGYYVVTYSSDT